MSDFYSKEAEFVISVLNDSGFDAYIVGGCVRDMLLKLPVHDYDIATSAKPEEVKNLFEKTIVTGEKHGTVTVIVNHMPIEVTTFRADGKYTDNRRPDAVEFVSNIKYDLSRRDFTINAMAYNDREGLIDLFGGKKDLKDRILRTVGDPYKRFSEDALRILRLYRFSSVLDFKIEPSTQSAAEECGGLLENISRERIFSELSRAACGRNTGILNRLLQSGALEFLGISFNKDLTVLKHLTDKKELRVFAFLYLCRCDFKAVLQNLKASNLQKKYCYDMEELIKTDNLTNKRNIKIALRHYSKAVIYDFLAFKNIIFGENIENPLKLIDEIEKNGEPYLLSDLKVNGNYLKKFGFKGNSIKDELEKLLNIIIEYPEKNNKEELTKIILKDG